MDLSVHLLSSPERLRDWSETEQTLTKVKANHYPLCHPFLTTELALDEDPFPNERTPPAQRRSDIAAPADEDSLPTRWSLLDRLGNMEDSDSWRTFFETYWRLIYNVARKSGLSDDEAQDVVQDTVIAVARKMPGFQYDPGKGSFKNWLLLICRRRIHDHLRRVYSSRQVRAEELGTQDVPSTLLPPDAQIDRDWGQEWRENVFHTALTRVRQQANPKHYQVFDCIVLQNMRVAEVASMLGLSAAQVYLAKHRISAAVKRAAREIEIEMIDRRAAA